MQIDETPLLICLVLHVLLICVTVLALNLLKKYAPNAPRVLSASLFLFLLFIVPYCYWPKKGRIW